MSVTIRTMTTDEFETFCQWSIEQQAKELMEESHITQEAATDEARREISEMLPKGLRTEHNFFQTILAEDTVAGFIWTLHEETDGRKQSFLCDFAIWEAQRRKGYGSKALLLAEKQAAEAGCQESVLFVADQNHAARTLYRKCGYQVLRPMKHGMYMVKQLPWNFP